MIALAVGLGVLGILALGRARRCHRGGVGPWASYGEDGHGEPDVHGHHGRHGWHRGGPPWWMRHRHRGRRGRRWMLHFALERLDATPAQERVIVGEIDRLQQRVRDVRGSLDGAHVDLAAAVRGPALDDAALGAVLGRADTATAEVRAAALDALRAIHAVLDDKQRAELADILETRDLRGRRDRERGRGGSRGDWFRMGPYR